MFIRTLVLRFLRVTAYVRPSKLSSVFHFHSKLMFSEARVEWDAQVEKSSFCRLVIHSRIQDGLAEPAPIHNDVCELKADQLSEDTDTLMGGFPCQASMLLFSLCQIHAISTSTYPSSFPCLHNFFIPAQDMSTAGEQLSMGGDRSILVKEFFRLWDESVALGRKMNLELH